MIADAQITFLPSDDLERSRAFYEGILGLELVVDQGTCHIFKVTDGAFLGTCQRDEVEATEGVIFTFDLRLTPDGARELIERGELRKTDRERTGTQPLIWDLPRLPSRPRRKPTGDPAIR